MAETKHPAKFSDAIMRIIAGTCVDYGITHVLDPFAGTGRIHQLQSMGITTEGIEIEPEWANMHPSTKVGDARHTFYPDDHWQAVITSPTYGNRLADSHNAKDGSRRYSYTHTLGRKLHPANSGTLQWGDEYKHFHTQAWLEARRILKPDGYMMLNISNHIRKGKEMPVTEWHVGMLGSIGFVIAEWMRAETPRLRFGQNHQKRVEYESVILFRQLGG